MTNKKRERHNLLNSTAHKSITAFNCVSIIPQARAKRIYTGIWGISFLISIFFLIPGVVGGMENGTVGTAAGFLYLLSFLAAVLATVPRE